MSFLCWNGFNRRDTTFLTDESADDYCDIGGKLSLQVFELKKPRIAAINGAAVGIGMTMTLPMQMQKREPNLLQRSER